MNEWRRYNDQISMSRLQNIQEFMRIQMVMLHNVVSQGDVLIHNTLHAHLTQFSKRDTFLQNDFNQTLTYNHSPFYHFVQDISEIQYPGRAVQLLRYQISMTSSTKQRNGIDTNYFPEPFLKLSHINKIQNTKYLNVHMCMYMYTCMYIHTYIHTYTYI